MKFEPFRKMQPRCATKYNLSPDVEAFVNVKYFGPDNNGDVNSKRCCYIKNGKRCEHASYYKFKRLNTPFTYCISCFGQPNSMGEEVYLLGKYTLDFRRDRLFGKKSPTIQPKFNITKEVEDFINVKHDNISRLKYGIDPATVCMLPKDTRCCYISHGVRCNSPAYFRRISAPFKYCKTCDNCKRTGEEMLLLK